MLPANMRAEVYLAMKSFCPFLLMSAVSLTCAAQDIDPATRQKYEQVLETEHHGGRISQQERQVLMSVYPKLNPPRDHMGFTALNDLGTGTYKGEQGGLYPGGSNTMPAAHLKAGLEQAAQVVPRDRDGKPSPDGKIVIMSIGMSNTTMEYQTFMKLAAQQHDLNPHVVLVDGAQGGQSAVETSDPRTNFWKVVDQRMKAANVTDQQVQAVWMFQVIVAPFRPFPQDVHRLQYLMEDTLRTAHQRYPNLRIAYLSSRIFAGFAMVPQSPEPHCYESGWAPKWIIEGQIWGYPEYNYDPAKGVVRFPWVAWGPYMWADGVRGRKDGLKWTREDFSTNDGMHPSNQGRERVAQLLLTFLKNDPTSKPWFTGDGQLTAAPTTPPQNAQAQAQGGANPQMAARLQQIRQKMQSGGQLTEEEKQFVQRARAPQGQGGKQPTQMAQSQPAAQAPNPETIRRKVQNGEELTPEERQFLQQRRAGAGGQGGANAQQLEERRRQYVKEHPPQSSVGLIPLTDLGTGKYKGEEGGLYAGGRNDPPKTHVAAGLKLAREIKPLDKDGNPSPDGKIVMLSIGFSNPSIEFPGFQKRVSQDPDINPKLVTVNGCVGSRASAEQADPNSRYWPEVQQRLDAAGVTAKQVQALWIKEVIPGAIGFPDKAKELAKHITATLNNIHDRFPNAKVAYLSSRTYGGWTEAGGSPEPGAYETGFAVKWVVMGQIDGKPELNFDRALGAVRSPWIEWGPYFWTDGIKGRKDGLVYLREDVREDGLHPSDKGTAKVAELMMKFFKNDPTTKIWFLK
jgi:hypothetical protein